MAPSDHWKSRDFNYSSKRPYSTKPLYADVRVDDLVTETERLFGNPRARPHEHFMDAWAEESSGTGHSAAIKKNPDAKLIKKFLSEHPRKEPITRKGRVIGFRYVA